MLMARDTVGSYPALIGEVCDAFLAQSTVGALTGTETSAFLTGVVAIRSTSPITQPATLSNPTFLLFSGRDTSEVLGVLPPTSGPGADTENPATAILAQTIESITKPYAVVISVDFFGTALPPVMPEPTMSCDVSVTSGGQYTPILSTLSPA